jgi:hypothetical protein
MNEEHIHHREIVSSLLVANITKFSHSSKYPNLISKTTCFQLI